MKVKSLFIARILFLATFFSIYMPAVAYADDTIATLINSNAKIEKGLCLIIDTNDGSLVASFAKLNKMYVQGCSWDAKNIQASRQLLMTAGVADRSSINLIEVDYLPYADNLINLVTCSNWGNKSITIEEVLRIMTPLGVAILGNDNKPDAIAGMEAKLKQAGVKEIKLLSRKGWIAFVKPENPNFDTWTQNQGGADLSSVNNDKGAGPWEEVRWVADPRWGALAGTYSGRVTSGGKIYYAEGRADHQWWVARDAYNGTELWREPLDGKGWVPLWGPGNSLTCDEKWAYATHKGVLIARDGNSGKIVKEYATGIASRTNTIIDKFILTSDIAKNIVKNGTVVALHKETGQILWKLPTVAHPPAANGLAFVSTDTDLEAIDIATGKSKWKTTLPKAEGLQKVFCKGEVVYIQFLPPWKPVGLLAAINVNSGALLWSKINPGGNYATMPYKDELVLLEFSKTIPSIVVDSITGNKKRDLDVKGFSGKCYPTTGSGNFLLYSNCSYLNVKSGAEVTQKTVRSPCFLGHVPANGLTYFLPHHCDCGISLRGFLAMSAASNRTWLTDKEKGGSPALFSSSTAPASITEKPEDWPMYRKDTLRSNFTTNKIPGNLKLLWTEKLGTSRLTQTVSAYGLIFLAEPQSHRVIARDALTGKEKWSFATEGRVEFAPSLHKGMCLFSTSGGMVYSLDALTGKEIWRLRAAPTEKYIAEEGQFASSWPVVGGVMPMNGEIFFSCGRSGDVEGGIWLFAVDAATGKTRWRVKGGSSGDFFLSDGKELHLTKNSFNISNGGLIGGGKAAASKGLLRTTAYLSYVSVVDYMACVEPSLSSEKHIELTNGITTGENLAFNDKVGVAAWRYRFGVGADLMKKERANQRFIYAKDASGAIKWRLDDGIKHQMMGIVLTEEIVFMAGIPTTFEPNAKSELCAISIVDGKTIQSIPLESRPTYDGLSAANGRLYLTTEDGNLMCFGVK